MMFWAIANVTEEEKNYKAEMWQPAKYTGS